MNAIKFSLVALVLAACFSLIGQAYGTPVALAAFVGLNGLAYSASVTGSACLGIRPPLKMPDFTGNFAANGKVTATLPPGVAYHQDTFHFQTAAVDMTVAQMKSMVTSIVAKVNSKEVRTWTPTALDVANATNGARFAAANGYLTDYFSEPWRRTWEGEERCAWGTDRTNGITYEITWSGTAVTPTVEHYAIADESNRPFDAYPIRQVRMNNALAVVNGLQQWPGQGIFKDTGMWYSRIHFLSALVTSASVKVNKVPKWDNVPRAFLAEWLAKNQGLSLQASTYTVAFDGLSQQLTDQLATFFINAAGNQQVLNELVVEWTGSGGGNVDILTELYQKFPIAA